MTLYEIAEKFEFLHSQAALDDIDAVLAELEQTEAEFHEKAAACVAVIRQNEGEAAAFEAEAKRMQAERQARENVARRVREHLLSQMKRAGIVQAGDGVLMAKVQRIGRPAVLVEADAVPDEYMRETVSRSPDKERIRALLDSGERVNWARFADDKRLKV